MVDFYNNNKEMCDKTFSLFALLFGTYIFFNYLFALFLPFIFGYLISAIIEPLIQFFVNKLKFKRIFASILSLFIFISLFALLFTIIGKQVTKTANEFVVMYPVIIEKTKWTLEKLQVLGGKVFFLLPDVIQKSLNAFVNNLLGNITSLVTENLKAFGLQFIKKVPSFASTFLVSFVSSIFFTLDKDLIDKNIKKYTPAEVSTFISKTKTNVITVITGYIKTQLKLMSITFTIATIGLLITRVKFALLVGVAIGLIDSIPMFGSGFILWPLGVYFFMTGDIYRCIAMFSIYGIIMLTRQMLEPRLLGKSISIHPLFILFAMYVGLKTMGVAGLIVGPLLLITSKYMIFNVDDETTSLEEVK